MLLGIELMESASTLLCHRCKTKSLLGGWGCAPMQDTLCPHLDALWLCVGQDAGSTQSGSRATHVKL
jgi:hypothetical protein